MNWNNVSFDWNHIRAFSAAVEEGSFSGAARVLEVTQPTLSRQISTLEQDLDVTLFLRGPRGMTLTDAGLGLLEHVQAMRDAAAGVSLAASGQAQRMEGPVTIAATGLNAAYLLPEIVKDLRVEASELTVSILPSNRTYDLNRREADIALRHAFTPHQDLIAQHLGTGSGGLYASQDYLTAKGITKGEEDPKDLDFIALELPTAPVTGSLDLILPPPILTTTGGSVLLELVRSGLGFSILPAHIANRFPELVRIQPDVLSIDIPFWLVTHGELQTSRRFRYTFDFLTTAIKQKIGLGLKQSR